MRAEKLVSLNNFSEQTVYYASSYAIFNSKTLSGAASESGERQKAIFAEKDLQKVIIFRQNVPKSL